jgi:RHS repeat-associated protein
LYIYLSNTSKGWDVFFDNLSILHYSRPLIEENHYYPFRPGMAGISDEAIKSQYTENKFHYNKDSELQNKEFPDGSGLEVYETKSRTLDPQLGRWWQVDPKTDVAYESVSPYAAMNGDPANLNDPNGDVPCCEIAQAVLQATQPLVNNAVNAHGQQKQSTGSKKKSGDNHMRPYKNNKKGNNKNPNQQKGVDERKNKAKPID